ncbi:MAG: D-glycero-beta-D-manno-heptose 1,7-bisphosphate 7-phosphatase [Verrucomicrobiota bacterium]
MHDKTGPEGERRALFLDRDGVVNVDRGYVSCVEDFEFMTDVFSVLRSLSSKGYLLVVVTNQSGIGRGYYTEEDFQKLTSWMLKRFADEGVEITAIYSCPHSPEEGCSCRKPEPGMILQAKEELGLNLSSSWMIGDKESDMQAAKAAGIPSRVLLGTEPSPSSTHAVESLEALLELPI